LSKLQQPLVYVIHIAVPHSPSAAAVSQLCEEW
jgi:hypothetical protein